MSRTKTLVLILTLGSLAAPADAHHRRRTELPGSYVGASVDVNGRRAVLYPAPDASGRHYFEAIEGAEYVVHLENRSHERLGVRLSVDGLNVIDGAEVVDAASPGRLYILDPRGRMTVRGWRSSLDDVHRFTFVDEERSYAARMGKASGRLGWIELDVFRERRRRDLVRREQEGPVAGDAAAAAPAPRSRAFENDAAQEGFPGTGWGERAHDRARLVHFDPERHPVQSGVLRYEYRAALVALGVLGPEPDRDRLAQREQGVDGFAPAPPPEWR